MAIGFSLYACPVGQWTNVALGVTSGMIHMIKGGPVYLQTFNAAGTGPPAPNTIGAVLLFNGEIHVPISASEPIDVYIFAF
jgi:hypothetical protein